MMGKTQIGLANIDWISKVMPLRGKESAKESFGDQKFIVWNLLSIGKGMTKEKLLL